MHGGAAAGCDPAGSVHSRDGWLRIVRESPQTPGNGEHPRYRTLGGAAGSGDQVAYEAYADGGLLPVSHRRHGVERETAYGFEEERCTDEEVGATQRLIHRWGIRRRG